MRTKRGCALNNIVACALQMWQALLGHRDYSSNTESMVLKAWCVAHSCSPALRTGDSRAGEISSSAVFNGPEATPSILEFDTILKSLYADEEDPVQWGTSILRQRASQPSRRGRHQDETEATGPVADKAGQPKDNDLPGTIFIELRIQANVSNYGINP